MRPAVLLGALLLVVAVISFAYQGITYTKKEKVIDLGPIEATAETRERIPLPPIVGAIALVGGLVLIFSGKRKA
jgi:hypothetical protein